MVPKRDIKIKHDGKITIAVGKSRFEKNWRNKEMMWSELIVKLSETKRTNETLAEFNKMTKKQQDQIKDVGGFVGGLLKEGRRISENAAWRQVVTLDADFADEGLWYSVELFLGDVAALAYSTHKHTPKKPRLRLVLPLSRPVTPDEYQAISRLIAADLGIDLFDDSTYQAHRLMYWPSTASDGKFFFEYQDGVWINADECLARYDDWQDQSLWPVSSRATDVIKREIKKQENPLDKPGVVGAFCRTYTVQAAIDKYLPDVYEACAMEGRYTYTQGTSSAGAVVYDDMFLYSHHATDPCSMKLVNAFDLVRIHKFGAQDDDVEPGTPTVKMPSYTQMRRLAIADEAVKVLIGKEQLEEAGLEFDDESTDWLGKLEINKWGRYENNAKNIKLIIENDKNLAGKLAMDDFAHRFTVLDDLPWRRLERSPRWTDNDESSLRNYLDEVYGIQKSNIVNDVLREVMVRHAFHPVREYLNGLHWDGNPRVETLFIDCFGAEDSEFNRLISRKTMAAAVARILKPGVKFDSVLTIVGTQGLGKTHIFKRLGGKWCSDSVTTLQGKEAMEQVQGFWIIELAELSALAKSELEAAKHFITKQDDSFRSAYGRYTDSFPRQCVFFATTNKLDFIRDQTGGRRWWPIVANIEKRKISPFDYLTDDVVNQIWAEAMVIYRAGEKLYLPKEMEEIAKAIQEIHTEESPVAGMIREYLEKEVPANWDSLNINDRRDFIRGDGFDTDMEGAFKRNKICALEVWVELLDGDPKRLDRLKSTEINDILRKTKGWEMGRGAMRFGTIYGKQRGFVRG